MKLPVKTLSGLSLGIMLGMTQTSCNNNSPAKIKTEQPGLNTPEEGNNSIPDSIKEDYCPPCGKG